MPLTGACCRPASRPVPKRVGCQNSAAEPAIASPTLTAMAVWRASRHEPKCSQRCLLRTPPGSPWKTMLQGTGVARQRLFCGLHHASLHDLAPPDEAPVLLDPTAQSDLVAFLRAHRVRQRNFREVVFLDSEDASTCRGRADVDHENLPLLQFRNLAGLRITIGLNAKQTPKKVVLHLDLDVDAGQPARVADNMADEAIAARECRVDFGANADQAAGDCELQRIVLRRQGHDSRTDWPADHRPRGVFANNARPDLDLVADLQDALEDGTTCDATLELFHLFARLVHIERTDNDHHWI
mmetsp:Transcript_87480/g.245616  ORF Transcript_87480/g.245616 Transcript_87480/m.245616 type:complete len:297 (+) Transcript_87480:2-892(+)